MAGATNAPLGGLSVVGGTEAGTGPLGGSGDDLDFSDAIHGFDSMPMAGNPTPADMYRTAYRGTPPDLNELRRDAGTYEKSMHANAAGLENTQLDKSLPWFKLASGLLKPTKTGSFGESLGSGLEGYTEGLSDMQTKRIELARAAAQLRGTGEENVFRNKSNIFTQDTNARKADQLLARMQQNQMLTPAIKEWMVSNGITPQDLMSGNINPEQKKDLQKYILLARGSNQMKNANAMLDANHPDYAGVVGLLSREGNMQKFMDLARKDLPPEQFVGYTQEQYNQALTSRAQELATLAYRMSNHGIGPGAAAGPAATLPAAAPSGAPGAIPPASQAARGVPSAEELPLGDPNAKATNLVDYANNNAKTWQQSAQVKQDLPSRKLLDDAAGEVYKKEILPGLSSGNDLLMAVRNLEEIDPKVGPASGWASVAGRIGQVLGLPDTHPLVKNAAKIDTAKAVTENLRNAILMKAVGPQTDSDARRAMAEVPSTESLPETYKDLVAIMKALGERQIEREQFHTGYIEKNAGQMAGATGAWTRIAKDVPLVKRVKFADGTSGLLTYNEFIKQHMDAGQTFEQALAALKKK